ncbi:hypothetical protein LPJ61_000125 [Coemansia biformis]|uniref:G-protein coupled receptors family 3 profile domain-containing protein n=1 Tax=Coemansia biformis TaxID=1286918 RepID=A0A9W7YIF2_9FUNG|nr:hypothetical protein LPJ61_000125 [Coemansia biformis]
MAGGSNGGGIAIIVICVLIILCNFAAATYCFIRRKYLPIKARNLPNMYLTCVAILMTFIGNVNTATFSGAGKEWMICTIAVGWLGMALGGMVFVAMLQLRAYSYFSVFILRRRAVGVFFILPVAYLIMLSVIYGALAFILAPSVGFDYIANDNTCVAGAGIYYTGMVFMIIQILVLGLLLFKARKMVSCFHEFRTMLIVYGVGVLCAIILVAINHVKWSSDQLVVYGILKILFAFIPQQVYFWIILAMPIYHSFRHPGSYLHSFVETVEEKGLSQVYEMAGKCPLGEISDLSDAGKSRRVTMDSQHSAGSNFSGNEPGPICSPPLPRADNVRQSGPLLSYYGSAWKPGAS